MTFSLAVVGSSMPYSTLRRLARELGNSKLEVQITFCGQDGSRLETIFLPLAVLTARTGERYGG